MRKEWGRWRGAARRWKEGVNWEREERERRGESNGGTGRRVGLASARQRGGRARTGLGLGSV
jgi:hypothetical protein